MTDTPPPRLGQTHGGGTPGPRESLLSHSGFDRFETRALDVMRLIFAAESGACPRHGASAQAVAASAFGHDMGPVLLVALSGFIHAMASSRRERFRYSNPYCAGCTRVITRDEAGLLRILHHLRRGHRGHAMIEALMLCEARPVETMMEAAADLAALSPPAPGGC